jgi:hypothetical protein
MANYIVWYNAGLKGIINANGGITWLNTLRLHLFSNNFTPAYPNVLGDFSECTFTGYASQLMTNWSVPAVNALPPNEDTSDVVHTFTATDGVTPNTIYGYYVTDAASAVLMFAQRTNIAVPAVLDAAGKSYLIQPRITDAPYLAYP